MKLIVGLGNPGLTYKNTRHNIGFMFLDELKRNYNLNFTLDKKFKGYIARCNIKGNDIIFLKPVTYMNLSGESVLSVVEYYKIDIKDILVIHDDMDLPVGKVRIRPNGSCGGQKGMGNIISLLKTEEISRIRIGIDKGNDSIEHVLGKLTGQEKEIILDVISKASFMLEDYLEMTFENFMNKYNSHAS